MERRLSAIFAVDMVGYSRLMEADETGTIERQKTLRREFIDPIFEKFHGHIINNTGDGLIAEFPSVVEAVECAVGIQQAMQRLELDVPKEKQIRYRIGINLGDVVFEDGDVYGDGVNIAARLEQLAEPGGICISGTVFDHIAGRSSFLCDFLGEQKLKNISRAVRAYRVAASMGNGTEIEEPPPSSAGDRLPSPAVEREFDLKDQSEVQFVLSTDGVSIAHAFVGIGYPLVVAGSWLTHLTWSWNPLATERGRLTSLSKHFQLIRYDQRGSGMSDWRNVDIEFDRMVDDLGRVIDCYPYEKVALYGRSQGAAVSIAYTVSHPERVSHLILHGGFARGRRRRGDPSETAQSEALVTLIRQNWAASNPAIRQTMTTLFMPDASAEEASFFKRISVGLRSGR